MGEFLSPASASHGYRRLMPASFPGRVLLAVRFVLGTTAWFTPKAFMTVIGMDPFANPQAGYMSRLFGVRDLTLGLGLLASRGNARRVWWRLGILCDLGDAAAGVVSARHGELPAKPLLTGVIAGAGLVGASLGAAALAGDDV
jgi:hypothetical protein